jgi:hypothetical protein
MMLDRTCKLSETSLFAGTAEGEGLAGYDWHFYKFPWLITQNKMQSQSHSSIAGTSQVLAGLGDGKSQKVSVQV